MFDRLLQLIKIARKLGSTGALETINEVYQIPFILKIFFDLISIGSKKKVHEINKTSGQKLCDAFEQMGTTFIKLGQFLATRPDIIGSDVASDLEKLQDKLPPFDIESAKEILKKEVGINNYNNIINFSGPIAAASIAQVHFAKINFNGEIKEVAIKILRPEIEKIFNKELDALMLLAYILEKTISKSKNPFLTL